LRCGTAPSCADGYAGDGASEAKGIREPGPGPMTFTVKLRGALGAVGTLLGWALRSFAPGHEVSLAALRALPVLLVGGAVAAMVGGAAGSRALRRWGPNAAQFGDVIGMVIGLMLLSASRFVDLVMGALAR
jgi:hypothetical protein